ncbi:hypothetical protein [Salipiger sp. PrR003]|uniref:hypothetical protein n=1 Tax=Salipiger sp. PrR003 TaxID=2706776 RepID=UPI0013DA01BE|nr:hypothetical protein [Salipiger sp. PrR003]NDV50147.1 hypothetical protein [Salipiger sp. PrR003]
MTMNSENKGELETLRSENARLQADLDRMKRQSDDWQTRGWEPGTQLDKAVEHLENMVGHVDTPIGRRRLNVDPSEGWLRGAREFCHQVNSKDGRPVYADLTAQRARKVAEIVGRLKSGLDRPVANSTTIAEGLDEISNVLATLPFNMEPGATSGDKVIIALDEGDIFELQDALREGAGTRAQNNARHRLEELLLAGLDLHPGEMPTA